MTIKEFSTRYDSVISLALGDVEDKDIADLKSLTEEIVEYFGDTSLLLLKPYIILTDYFINLDKLSEAQIYSEKLLEIYGGAYINGLVGVFHSYDTHIHLHQRLGNEERAKREFESLTEKIASVQRMATHSWEMKSVSRKTDLDL